MPSGLQSRVILLAVIAGLVGSPSHSKSAEPLEPITYTVRFPSPDTHYAEVSATVPTGKRPAIDLMMPVWTPGFYRVENYASRVEDLSAQSPDGKKLTVQQPRKNRWQIETGGAPAVTVSYRLMCNGRSVTGNWVDDDYAVLNGAAAFVTLAEQARRPHEVRLELPGKWKRSMTALADAPGGRPHQFRAADFDELVDSPIVAGNPSVAEFNVTGSKHYVVGFGATASWNEQRAAGDLEKIVRAHHRLWGFLPFKKYVFLLAFRPGGGGLEHKNSTLVTTSANAMQSPRGYQSWLGLVCHEYFHAFNVKRLRPIELGPFDYENGARTPSLWVAEGLSVYYDQVLLARAGLCSPEDYLARLSANIGQLQKSPGRLLQSLEQSSNEVWTNSMSGIGTNAQSVSYYVKGPVVGFLLDARIRNATNGAKCLDDVMRLAFSRYSGERGFTPEQFRSTATEAAGVDLIEWIKKAVASTEELDYAEALDWFGLQFAPGAGEPAAKTWRLEVRPDTTAAQRKRLAAWLTAVPAVTAPPASVFEKFRERDREEARKFYMKHIDIRGVPVLASADVADEALQRTHELVTHLLAGRPDILQAMAQYGTRLIIIGKDQVYTDMPEYRNHPNPQYQNERVRGTGGLDVTSFGEENLLNLPLDRYDDESIAVHEFCHTIDAAVSRMEPDWRERLLKIYRGTVDRGLWRNAYTASNPAEYWAEICQSYFDCNRINNWNHAAIGSREQLKQYDPEGYEFVKATFKMTHDNDWRYQPLRRQPSVTPPPANYKIDPYYSKFTYAREFLVLGSKHASDEALLKANDTIRRMFAYRHDILKAMIADGARLVVLGRHEQLGDLPEFKEARNRAGFDAVRYLDYSSGMKLMVVPEENVLLLSGEPFAGKCMTVSVFARGLYQVAGLRPIDPDFERRRGKQQYELGVKRLDVEFDQKLQKIHEQATGKGLWKGSPAAGSRFEYWAAGVEAYFDAAGDGLVPNLADRPIASREALKAYDPDLFALVHETMAFAGRVDWRVKR